MHPGTDDLSHWHLQMWGPGPAGLCPYCSWGGGGPVLRVDGSRYHTPIRSMHFQVGDSHGGSCAWIHALSMCWGPAAGHQPEESYAARISCWEIPRVHVCRCATGIPCRGILMACNKKKRALPFKGLQTVTTLGCSSMSGHLEHGHGLQCLFLVTCAAIKIVMVS